MKLAFPVDQNDLNTQLSGTFGRAKGFIIYDTQTDTHTYLDNIQQVNAAQGAGIQAAQQIVEGGADALISQHCGPKAFRVLSAAGATVYCVREGTVQEHLSAFREGLLNASADADVEGHWL